MSVQDLMSRSVQSCRPVVDGQGALVGMLSLADLAREAGRSKGTSAQISDEEVAGALVAICSPPSSRLPA